MIKTLIKQGINRGIDDSSKIRRAVYRWLGREERGQTVQSFVPFGTFGCAQEGTLGLLFAIRGDESNVVALDGDPENRIKKDCKPGEYGIGNPLTRANIYFKEDGNVVIEVPRGTLLFQSADGNIEAEATEINFNSGDKGVARLDDSTISSASEDATFWTFWNAIFGVLSGSPIPEPGNGSPSALQTALALAITGAGGIPSAINGKINNASSTVKAG